MKFALSSRQTPEYLEKADEIRIQYRDKDIIYDFIEKYPNKTFILEIPFYVKEEEIDYTEIKSFSEMSTNFICRVSRIENIIKFDELNIHWYYGMIIDQWNDLIHLANTNTEYVLIGGDLFFNLPKVKQYGIPVRAVPNISNISQFMNIADVDFDASIVGDWFPPEGINIYKDYIATIEFENCSLQQERGLYRAFSKNEWKGDLCLLITNLKTPAEGYLINPDWFCTNRLDCNRICLSQNNIGCQLCYRQFALANYEKLKAYKEEILDKKDTN